MNAVDVGILIIVGLFAVGGLRRGFMLGLVDLVGFGLAVVVGARMAETLAQPLRDRGLPPDLAMGSGFVIAAVVSLAAIGLAARILLSPLRAFGGDTPLGWVNGVLGLLPGAVRGLAVAALVVMSLQALPPQVGVHPAIAASRLARPLMETGREALDAGLAWAGIDPRAFGVFFRPAPPAISSLPSSASSTR